MVDHVGMGSYVVTFADAAYDLDGVPYGAAPSRSILVCSTPRSGSNWLGDVLRQCGGGVPMEYFEASAMARLGRRWGTQKMDAYLAALHHHRTTADGVFGAKIHWHQLLMLCDRVGVEPRPGRILGLLRQLTPNPTFVHLSRDDHVRQAVSLRIAEATGDYAAIGADPSDAPPVAYDFDAVHTRYRALQRQSQRWPQLLSAMGVAPVSITYEQLGDTDAVAGLLDALDLDVPDDLSSLRPATRRQSSDAKDAMVERFRDDLERARTPARA